MLSTFEDLKNNLINTGKKIIDNDEITYEKTFHWDDTEGPFYGFFNVEMNGDIIFSRISDITLRYNETLNVIQECFPTIIHFSITDKWETIKFDDDSHYFDKHYIEYYPLYCYTFVNDQKSIDDFIENYKKQYHEEYMHLINERIEAANEAIEKHNSEISKIQSELDIEREKLKKLKYIKDPIPDFLQNIKDGDKIKCQTFNNKTVSIRRVMCDKILWDVCNEKKCYHTYLNGIPIKGDFFIINNQMVSDFKIIKKA